jgi:hypothetical protein
MKPIFRPALIAAASLGLLAAPALADDHAKEEMTKGETELAKLLEGRVAGEPQRCISTFRDSRMRVIEKTAYVFGSGNTIYVQRTKNPADIDDDDILVTRIWGSHLCRLDNVTTIDRSSRFFSGVVFFEDFVPYTRVKDTNEEDAGEDEAND